ncbi:MAG: hypothetical protein KKB50_05075 [Planctomycetes bacterium]|nr:hypothetical protein [Planctomycetota bacterium]
MPKREAQSDAPYGTIPARARRPLVVLVILYALWFAFLLWAAIMCSLK